MSSIDSLPPDQRAVLQLVLQRGRSYDDIAGLLAIDRSAVRQRALDAVVGLVPAGGAQPTEPGLVTDYLLSQLSGPVAQDVHGLLRSSQGDREWAQAAAAELSKLVGSPLPEIPVAGAPLGADIRSVDEPAPAPERIEPEPVVEPELSAGPEPPVYEPAPVLDRESQPRTLDEYPRTSRRGGAILLGAVAAVVVVVVVVAILLITGGSSSKKPGGSSVAASSKTSTSTTATSGTTTTAAKPQLLAALDLTSPSGDSKEAGLAEVVREDGVLGVVIDAQGLPANGPHNAYAVWLYKSPTDSKFVGFVPNLVGKNGKLQTEGKLPSDAAQYSRLLVTLETQGNPKKPGQVVLSGPFREKSAS